MADFKLLWSAHLRPVALTWVNGTKLGWVNYPALRRDFPKLTTYTDEQIDELILLNFSYITDLQLLLNGIRNTPIPADLTRKRSSFRPSAYGRADVVEFLDFDGTLLGLVDRKGSGGDNYIVEKNLSFVGRMPPDELAVHDHSDGLMSLGEAIVETTRERARRRLYQIENTLGQTVESYFVMLFPFQILKGNGNSIPAGLYGRQAHLGRDMMDFETPLPASESSANQQDHFGAGVDQGLVTIKDSRLEKTFGAFGSRHAFKPQQRADWAWAHETALSFANGGPRSVVESHIKAMTAPLDDLGPDDLGVRGATAEEELKNFLKSHVFAEDPTKRRMAANSLRHLPASEENMKLLERLLLDPEAKVRAMALFGLPRMPAERRLAWLLRFARTEQDKTVLHSLTSPLTLSRAERPLVYRTAAEHLGKVIKDSAERAAYRDLIVERARFSFGGLPESLRMIQEIQDHFDLGKPFVELARDAFCEQVLNPPFSPGGH